MQHLHAMVSQWQNTTVAFVNFLMMKGTDTFYDIINHFSEFFFLSYFFYRSMMLKKLHS